MAERRRFRSIGTDTHFVKFFIVCVRNRLGACQAGEVSLRLINDSLSSFSAQPLKVGLTGLAPSLQLLFF